METGRNLSEIPFWREMLHRGDDRMSPYLSDTLVQATPDAVYRARDPKDLSQILEYCHREKIPVTPCGSQTSLTGASVADRGVLVTMEKRNRLLDMDPGRLSPEPASATAEAGILLGDFQRMVADAGWFYPPDPTSKNEAQLGGTIGTNATGEDSLLYGPTRRYIRALKILLADGRETVLERKKPYRGPTKNRAGYWMDGDPIEPFIGSEGTLGIILEATVDLLQASPPFFLAWAFFPDLDSALEFVVTARGSREVSPRSMELLDRACLEIIAGQEKAPRLPTAAGAAITFKQEYRDVADQEQKMGAWLSLIEPILRSREAASLINDIVVAESPSDQEHLRLLRHSVPSFINEKATALRKEGGGKISTDWWVPVESIRTAMASVREWSGTLGVPTYCFGHIGDGHPHINYLSRNAAEKKKVEALLEEQCRRAAKIGGGVAGEHGLGKIHRNLLALQCRPGETAKMLAIKKQFDPQGILSPGNIFG